VASREFREVLHAGPAAAPEELVYTSPPRKDPSDWSSNGRLLFTQYVRRGYSDIWQLDLQPESTPESLVEKPGRQAAARFSPDGRFIAYESDESGQRQVFVLELGARRRRWQVTSNGGGQPQWRGDGRELFIASGAGVSSSTVSWTGDTPSFGPPRLLFPANLGSGLRNSFAPSPDGTRFLVIEQEELPGPSPLTVVVNWRP